MPDPLILIVGSANPARTDYDPPLTSPEGAPAAAEDLGAELARRGCRIVVYSAKSTYLEGAVVRGFAAAAAKKNAKGRIQVRYPHNAPGSAKFPEAQTRQELFEPKADRNAGWEEAFYASLKDADGLLIIGGGRSAHAIGQMALAFEIPLVALACFGGAAKAVWLAIEPEAGLISKTARDAMNPPEWNKACAPGLVESLFAQEKIRRSQALASAAELRGRAATRRIATAVGVLLLAIAATIWGYTQQGSNSRPEYLAALFLVGPIAGAGSALASAAWRDAGAERSLVATAGLGFVAGLISSVFYLLAQFTTAKDTQSISNNAMVVAFATGFAAGFTVDQIFKRATEGKPPTTQRAGQSAHDHAGD